MSSMRGGGGARASGTASGLKRTAAEVQSGSGEADADGEGGGHPTKKEKETRQAAGRKNMRKKAREEAPAGASEHR